MKKKNKNNLWMELIEKEIFQENIQIISKMASSVWYAASINRIGWTAYSIKLSEDAEVALNYWSLGQCRLKWQLLALTEAAPGVQ